MTATDSSLGQPQAAGLRVTLAALCCQKGDLAGNLAAHREVLSQASETRCHMVVFPEMSLTGSVDPRTSPGHLASLESAPVRALVESTHEFSVAAVFGVAELGGDGAPHITQVYACQGAIMGSYRKRHLGEGEEGYTPGTESALFRFGALSFGIAICAESDVDYPFDEPARAGAEVVFFCAAPGLHGRRTEEESWRSGHAWWETQGLGGACRHAARTGAWIAMSTQAGSTIDEDFPGIAALVAPSGEVVERLPDWREGTLVVDIPVRIDVEPAREAARVLVVDQTGRAVLVRFADGAGHSWWVPPGGGLDGDEDYLSAARRELAEELARDDIEIGPEIGGRSLTFSFNGPWMTQRERWYLARCESFEVPPEHVATLAPEGVVEVRWWSAEELVAESAVTAPRGLARLLTAVNHGAIPDPDTDLGP